MDPGNIKEYFNDDFKQHQISIQNQLFKKWVKD